jgi:hypothetical protein
MKTFGLLRELIRQKYGSQDSFCADMEMARSTLNGRLNSRTEWTRPEMEKACILLDIPIEKMHIYFF